MKECPKCKRMLPSSEFYKNKTKKDGYSNWCKKCNYNYQMSERGEKARKKYYCSEKGIRTREEWRKTENYMISVKKAQKKHYGTEKYKISLKRYQQSEKGKIAMYRKTKKFRKTESGKKSRFKERRKYNASEKGKKAKKRYAMSEKGRRAKIRGQSKRRGLKHIVLIDNIFPMPIDWHHVHNWFVIPLPHSIHDKFPPNTIEIHRERANIWIKKLYNIDIERILGG